MVTVLLRRLWRIGWEQDPERNTLVQERVQDRDLSIKNVLTVKNCADVGTKPVSAFRTTTALHDFAGLVFKATMDSTLHHKMMGHLVKRASAGCETERNRKLSGYVV